MLGTLPTRILVRVALRWIRITVCFVILPLLPALAIFLPASPPSLPIFGDRIVLGVFAWVVVALGSGALAWATGAGRGEAVAYALATGGLTVIAFFMILFTLLTVVCGAGSADC